MTRSRKTILLLLALDLASIIAVFNLCSHFYLRSGLHLTVLPLLFPFAALAFALYLVGGYRAQTDQGTIEYTSLHGLAVIAAFLTTMLLTFAFLPGGFELQGSRVVITASFLLLVPLTLSYRRMLHRRFARNRQEHRIVFVGDPASCAAFQEECVKMSVSQPVIYLVIGEAVDAAPLPPGMDIRSFESVLAELESGRLKAEAIVLRESSSNLSSETAEKLVRIYFSGIPTYTLELFHQVYWLKIPLYRLNPTWLFQEGFQIAREPIFERIKRTLDIALTLVGLLFASIVIALAGLAIWLEDRGPVFFFQTRIGRNHVPFRLVKLRTMRPNDGKGDPYTRPGDSRVTHVGRILRATRLDELPQLWNVLIGDMSVIGPRPEWDRLVEDYESKIPCYSFRHLVRPGITGWAQVNYRYGACFEDTLRKLEYDLYYIRHFSFVMDAAIFLKTIQIMIFGKGR